MNTKKMKSFGYNSKALFDLKAGAFDTIPKAPPSGSCPNGGGHVWYKKGHCYYQCGSCKGFKTYHEGYSSPTCTSKGYCDCGSDYKPATGHSFSSSYEYCRNGCGTRNPNYHTHSYSWVNDYVNNSYHHKYKKCSCGAITSDMGNISHNVPSWGSWYNDSGEGKCKSQGTCSDCNYTIAKWKSHRLSTRYAQYTADQHKRIVSCGDCTYENMFFESHDTSGQPSYIENGWIKKNCRYCGEAVLIEQIAPPRITPYASSTDTSVSGSMSISGSYTGCSMSIYQNGLQKTHDTDVLSISFNSAIPDTEYLIVYEAWNQGGNTKEQLTIRTKPAANPPQILNVNASCNLTSSEDLEIIINFQTKYATNYSVRLYGNGIDETQSGALSVDSKSVFFERGLRQSTTYNWTVQATSSNPNKATRSGTITTLSQAPYISYMEVTGTTDSAANAYVETTGTTPTSYKWYVDRVEKMTTTSRSVTITGLKGSTKYLLGCRAVNSYGTSNTSEMEFYTKQGKFYWSSGSGPNGEFVKGDAFNRLKDTEWNDFIQAIQNRYKDQYGGYPNMNTVNKGDKLLAIQYNKVLEILGQLSGIGVLPPSVKPNMVIQADYHINSLARAFNNSIGKHITRSYNPYLFEENRFDLYNKYNLTGGEEYDSKNTNDL